MFFVNVWFDEKWTWHAHSERLSFIWNEVEDAKSRGLRWRINIPVWVE